MANYIPSVGMEVHAELLTHSKMFCRCPVAFGGEPNTRVCPVCMGLPGTLPVPNRSAIEMALRTSLALNCKIAYESVFHRKNYFYPDLPKGYQVSQYGETNPLGYHGWVEIPSGDGYQRVSIRRVHLEEDTGKLMHLPSGGSGVDYNRAGVPLMEIVTGFPPDISTPDESKEYLYQLRLILLYLEVCDGKLEHGSMRCEPNISVRPDDQSELGTKTELKNLNSFRSVQLGVQFEVRRQVAVLEGGGRVAQETRGWNDTSETSFLMRTKETEQDYRYFACPDLIPMHFTEEYIEGLRAELPELPLAKLRRYRDDYLLGEKDARRLVEDRHWAEFFEEGIKLGGDPKLVCNWMISDFARLLNETGQVISERAKDDDAHDVSKVTPAHIVDLVNLVSKGTISGKTAKDIFDEMFKSGDFASSLVEKKGATQISDSDQILAWVREALAKNPDVVGKYKSGQTNVIGFLVGQVMKSSQGRANAPMVQDLVKKELE
ncbi:MAG: Asp-tRNA(Asn)/Glu-tRNA(Gln) amidotransferase subunit GatB [Armatimonadetes bacterium]|nr:Asp-tRNA(Asn)/Glu-tRNA(Gln) amidotransferase subunit GatB [Armatimonadota bacterium]